MKASKTGFLTTVSLIWLSLAASAGAAENWAEAMFATTSHDFGSVAKGAKSEFRFELQNKYKEQVHIASVRSSCGCTSPRIEKDTLASLESTAIIAELNTRAFQGSKNATVTVVFDRPFYAEVQLRVAAYIRTDVVFEPGSVSFGDVEQGAEREVRVAVSYAGRSDWEIVDVRSACPHLEAELVEKHRGGGRVDYEVLVRLTGEAPSGHVNDLISVITNDRNLTSIPLTVEGHVRGALEVSPAILSLGQPTADRPVTKKLFLRGREPLTVISAKVNDPAIRVEIPTETKATLFVPISVHVEGAARTIDEVVTLTTSAGEVSVRVQAVIPQ